MIHIENNLFGVINLLSTLKQTYKMISVIISGFIMNICQMDTYTLPDTRTLSQSLSGVI